LLDCVPCAKTIEVPNKNKNAQIEILNKFIAFCVLIVMFSGCSYRIIDFTVISSKNHGLSFDKSQGKKAEGSKLMLLGLGCTIKGAMDKALEAAGPDYDLLLDGVVFEQFYIIVNGYKVTGLAVRSKDLKAQLGEEGFQNWCKVNNVFDPSTAVVQN
jgi:hypothetical protein